MAKQVMDIHPGKGGMSASQSNEHLRNWDERKWIFESRKGNYDRTRSHLNFEIITGGVIIPLNGQQTSITRRMKQNLKDRGIIDPNQKELSKPRKPGVKPREYVTVANIIFGGSRARMHEIAFGDQHVDVEHHGVDHSHIVRNKDIEDWALDVYKFACDHWGEENIIGFCVHLDEMNPHIHCSVLPIKDGRFNYNFLFNNQSNQGVLDGYHDDFAELNKKWGLDRGDSVALTGAKHRSTEEYRRQLSAQNTELEKRNSGLERHSTILVDRIAAMQREIEELQFSIAENELSLSELIGQSSVANRRVKSLTTMLDNLDKRKNALENEIAKLTVRADAKDATLSSIQWQLDRVVESIELKKAELQTAEIKLALLSGKRDSLQDDIDAITIEIEQSQDFRALTEKEKSVLNFQQVAAAGLEAVLHNFSSIFSGMTKEEAKKFDDSLICDLMNNAGDILKCATLLFMGMTQAAIDYSSSVGGGGGGSDDSWWKPRKDDESDLLWARRCFFQAYRMMAPKHRRKGQKR